MERAREHTVGFAGLGLMGWPMAARIFDSGLPLAVWTRSRDKTVRESLAGGFAASRVLELHGQRMIDVDFAPGGRCRTQLKDLQQAPGLAADLRVEMPVTRLCRDLYERLIERGDGDLDHSALVREIRARS
jgi:3-hydroxyisobutyrate dehydrogenase-like beta-hydroxyacid dehydrogenase